MSVVRFALRFPHTFYVLAALIAFLGIIAIHNTRTDIFPEIRIPVVSVIWSYTGLSTPEMEQRVTTYSQYAMSTSVTGIKNMEAQLVRVPEIPNRTFPGKVTRIADALQPGTRTLLTEIDVPNPDGALAVGIYCTVELHIPRKTPSLLVPSEALIFNRDGPQVAVVEEAAVRIRKVLVVRDLGTSLELNDGVKPGDKVVLNPGVNLTEGSRVRTSR